MFTKGDDTYARAANCKTGGGVLHSTTGVGVLGTGVPRLACLRPAAWLKWGPNAAQLHHLKLKTLARGQASRGGRQEASSGEASPGRLARRRRDQGRVPPKEPVTQAMMIEDQAGAGLRSVLVSPSVQRWQAHAKASAKGYRFGATRPRPAERQDGGHRGAQDRVIVRPFGSRRPTLVRISVPDVPLENGQLLAPFPLIVWGEAQGLRL